MDCEPVTSLILWRSRLSRCLRNHPVYCEFAELSVTVGGEPRRRFTGFRRRETRFSRVSCSNPFVRLHSALNYSGNSRLLRSDHAAFPSSSVLQRRGHLFELDHCNSFAGISNWEIVHLLCYVPFGVLSILYITVDLALSHCSMGESSSIGASQTVQ